MTGPSTPGSPLDPQHLSAVPPTPLTTEEEVTRQRQRTSWTAAELMDEDFPEPRWAVPGILAEGVNLLAGPPKVGKSWLSLGLGLAVASGGTAFDSLPVDGGPVLYLALEDTGRRLQSRIRKVLAGRPAPAELTLATVCRPLPQGGSEDITDWLQRHPDARLVVIDVFAKVRGSVAPGANAYDADYAAVGYAKRLADRFGVALVLVHHVRKAGSDDFLTEVSGTNGLAGAADATLVLKRARGQADAVLHVTGRDVEEAEYALQFQPAAGAWHLLDGPATDHLLGDTRAAILRAVRDRPGARPRDLADLLPDIDADTVRRTCARMADDGQLTKDAGGRYFPDTGTRTRDTPELSHLSGYDADQQKQPDSSQTIVSHLSGSDDPTEQNRRSE